MKKYIIPIPTALNNYIEQLNYELIFLQNLCPFIQSEQKKEHIINIKKKKLELIIAQKYLIDYLAPKRKNSPFTINFDVSLLIVEEPNDT